MATLQQQKAATDRNNLLTYRFLTAVLLIVFLLWLAGLNFLEPNPYALYIFTGLILAAVTLVAAGHARVSKATLKKQPEELTFLKELPAPFKLFSHVSIGVRTTFSAVIVGEKGVFIVDVKTRSGKIEPTLGSDWIRHKVTSKGTPYRVPMKNPLQQLKRDIRELQAYLASCGVRPWIDASIYFTRAEFTEEVEGCYTKSDAVLAHIENFNDDHLLSEKEQETIAAALAERQTLH